MKHSMGKTVAILIVTAVMSLAMGSAVAAVAVSDPVQITDNYDLALAVSSGLLFASSLLHRYVPGVRRETNVLAMAIQQEIWVDRIVEPLFADNGVLSKVQRVDDSYIFGGSVVHIPQAGAGANIEKNRAVFPGVAVQRTDTDVTYPLDVFTSDPVFVTDAESLEVSYRKMDSVLKNVRPNMVQRVTNEMLHAWSGVGAGQIERTTGALVATNLAPGATGTRRSITYADIVALMTKFDDQDVPSEERYLLLDAIMYGELLKDTEITKMSIEKLADRAKGIVAQVAGFNIMKRSTVCVFTNASPPVKKAPGAATAVTDNRSALAWQRDCLNAALGEVKVYESIDDPLYYGSILSAGLKAGGRQERADGKGVVSLVQAAA